jgi:hypothetical protein
MALQPDWVNKVITIPKADLTIISGTLYSLDIPSLKLWLGLLSTTTEGMMYDWIFNHNPEATIVGTTYARLLEIINGYQIEFEDGQYTVKLIGANTNVHDVQGGILVRNQVQVIPSNSAGLIVVTQGSGVTAQDVIDIGNEAATKTWEKVL